MSSHNIPEGFHFSPSDEGLLMSYLRRMVLGQPLPWHGISEKQLYGNENPWELFSDDDPWEIPINADDDSNHKKIIYVFTKLSKVGRNGKKKIVRTAGCGTWHGQTGAKDIHMRSSGKTKTKIGSKRMFTFKPTNGLDTKGHWTTQEYSLSEDILTTDYVICKITKIDQSKVDHPEISHGEVEVLISVRCYEDMQITQVSDTTIPQLPYYPDNAQGQMMITEDASGTAPCSMEYNYNNAEIQPFVADSGLPDDRFASDLQDDLDHGGTAPNYNNTDIFDASTPNLSNPQELETFVGDDDILDMSFLDDNFWEQLGDLHETQVRMEDFISAEYYMPQFHQAS